MEKTMYLQTSIKQKGTIELHDLPLEVGEEVNITISKIEQTLTKEERLVKVKKTFGTIKNKSIIPLESLRRENLYGEDER